MCYYDLVHDEMSKSFLNVKAIIPERRRQKGVGLQENDMKPTFEIIEHEAGFRLVKFEIPEGVTTPEELAAAMTELPALAGELPILINGRGPVWCYGMLIHSAHPTPAVGCYDPRLGGYVIVASHDARYTVGDVIPDPEA